MSGTMADDKRFVDYLLGALPEEDREELERRFFEDDNLAAEMMAAEEHLIESYSSGTLDSAQKHRFEQIYGETSALREHVSLHKLLQSGTTAKRTGTIPKDTRRTVSLLALAACVALLALGLALLFRENQQLKSDIENIHAAQKEFPGNEPKPGPLTSQNDPGSASQQEGITIRRGSAVPAIVLFSGVREGKTSPPVVKPPADAGLFVLEASIKRTGVKYRSRVETVDGAVLYEAGPLTGIPESNGMERVSVPIPANQLQPGDYILSIQQTSTGTTVSQYYFRLAKP